MPKKLMAGTAQDAVSQMWARALVQREMESRGMSYANLTKRLADLGVNDKEKNVRNKVARGTFSAGFFLTALHAMGCRTLNLSIGVPGGDIDQFLRDPKAVVGPGYGVAIMTFPTVEHVLQQQKDNEQKGGAGDEAENGSSKTKPNSAGRE